MGQPIWKLVANLGDVNPIDHGGYFIYRDETGNYTEEAEVLEIVDDDNAEPKWIVHRFILERCTNANGVLSENKFYLIPAWFATPEEQKAKRPQDTTYLSSVARGSNTTVEELQTSLCSADPIERAAAYRLVGDYHGWDNFDPYPLEFADRSEIETRYLKTSR